jgi:hypothetical protein
LPRFILSRRKEGDGRQQQFGKAHARSSAMEAGFLLSMPQMELWRTVDTFRSTHVASINILLHFFTDVTTAATKTSARAVSTVT